MNNFARTQKSMAQLAHLEKHTWKKKPRISGFKIDSNYSTL